MRRFELLRALMVAKHAVSLYPEGHSVVMDKTGKLLEIINALRKDDSQVQISIVQGEALINGELFRQESLEFSGFIKELMDTGINRISFHPGTNLQELILFLSYLNERYRDDFDSQVSRDTLQKRGIHHITVSKIIPLRLAEKVLPEDKSSEPDTEYRRAVFRVKQIFQEVVETGVFPLGKVQSSVQQLLHKTLQQEATLEALFNVKRYDDYTFRHSVNVALLSLLMGKELCLPHEVLSVVGEAALMHDIGKMMVPSEIINKPGPLNADEWEVITKHPFLGAEILSSVSRINPLVPRASLEHHVRYDGGGYPHLEVLSRDNYLAQIVSICDFYDALTTVRSYRDPMSPHEAMSLIARSENNQFNPALAKVFIRVVGFFPVGTWVQTNRGEVGVVVRTNHGDPLHPVIKVIKEKKNAFSFHVDTSLRDSGNGSYIRHITRVLGSQTHLLDKSSLLRQHKQAE